MNDQLTTHRFVAVLNKKIPVSNLMNALGHMAAGFTALYPDEEALRFDSCIDKDSGEHSSIPDNPFIVLSADNWVKLNKQGKNHMRRVSSRF